MLNDKVYNILKWVALIALPALATFLGIVLPLWNVCDEGTTTAVVSTVTAVGTLIGTLIGVSTKIYNGGKNK